MNLEKIYFEIKDSEEEFTESLWAEKVGANSYRIDNVPFYSVEVSYNDIVSTKDRENLLFYKEPVERGRHSTFRVYFSPQFKDDAERVESLRKIEFLGCGIERATERLFAIDVPPATSLKQVFDFLTEGEKKGLWEFEEGFIYKES